MYLETVFSPILGLSFTGWRSAVSIRLLVKNEYSQTGWGMVAGSCWLLLYEIGCTIMKNASFTAKG